MANMVIDAPLGIVPRWARNLVRRVLKDYGSEIPLMEIRWRTNKRRFHTTGTSCTLVHSGVWVVTITQGTDLQDCRWALLHELAHVLVGLNDTHSRAFHRFAFAMYPQYDLSPGFSIWREANSRFAMPAAEDLGYYRIAARLRWLFDNDGYNGWDYKAQLWGLKHVY